MTFEPEPERPARLSMLSAPGIYVLAITAPVLFLIVQWNGLHTWTWEACRQLF